VWFAFLKGKNDIEVKIVNANSGKKLSETIIKRVTELVLLYKE